MSGFHVYGMPMTSTSGPSQFIASHTNSVWDLKVKLFSLTHASSSVTFCRPHCAFCFPYPLVMGRFRLGFQRMLRGLRTNSHWISLGVEHLASSGSFENSSPNLWLLEIAESAYPLAIYFWDWTGHLWALQQRKDCKYLTDFSTLPTLHQLPSC